MSALLNDTLTIDITPPEHIRQPSEREEVVFVKFIVADVDVEGALLANGIDPVSATPAERSAARHSLVREYVAIHE